MTDETDDEEENQGHVNLGNIGFLSDEKRLNVLATRAKKLVILLGDFNMLSKDLSWSKYIDYVKNNGYNMNSYIENDKSWYKKELGRYITLLRKNVHSQ